VTKRELETLRAEIERIDHDIIELVSRRQDVSDEIGRVKSKDGLRLRDLGREKAVVREYEKRAQALGMDQAIGRKFAQLAISASVSEQKVKRTRALEGTSVLVVGGGGKMGEWSCRLLSTRGADVRVFDPRRKLKGYANIRKLPSSLEPFGMIVIASPPGVCPDDLDEVLDREPVGLVFDLCSVKAHIAARLRRGASDGLLVTSVHPMFGPNAPSPRRRNIVVCRCGCAEADRRAARLFSSEGAFVSTLDIEEHDELMAYVLGLSHMCTLLFSGTIAASGRPADDLKAVQGPSFSRLVRLASELSNESRRVYHDIQALNPNTRRMVATMEEVLRALRKAALDSDSQRFRQIMDSDNKYLEVSG